MSCHGELGYMYGRGEHSSGKLESWACDRHSGEPQADKDLTSLSSPILSAPLNPIVVESHACMFLNASLSTNAATFGLQVGSGSSVNRKGYGARRQNVQPVMDGYCP